MKRYRVTINGKSAVVTGAEADKQLEPCERGNERLSQLAAVQIAGEKLFGKQQEKLFGKKALYLCDGFDDFLKTEAEIVIPGWPKGQEVYLAKNAKVSIEYI